MMGSRRGKVIALTLAIVVLGGLLGWSIELFAGYDDGPLIGLGVTVVGLAGLAYRSRAPILVAGFAIVFATTWLPLWFVVALVRWLITGQALYD
jgi:hypothetical protein